jgi:hypothetical protein
MQGPKFKPQKKNAISLASLYQIARLGSEVIAYKFDTCGADMIIMCLCGC